MKFPSLPLLVLDTETTGFVPRVHRVIEYAATKIESGNVTTEYESLFSIPGEIPPHIEVLTHIRTSDLVGQPIFADKKTEIEAMLTPETIIVGQNIGFDIGMLKGEGLDLSKYETIDTSLLASIVFPEFESYSLGFMSTILNLDHTPKHRALGDVRATLGVLQKCIERLSELPKTLLQDIVALADRGPIGYRTFFRSIEAGTSKAKPKWLHVPSAETFKPEKEIKLSLANEPAGTAELLEESLDPAYIEEVFDALVTKKGKRHFVGVKNLEATVRRIDLPKGVSVLYGPQLLLSEESAKKFLTQGTFTADELILAIKLLLFTPKKQPDLPLHGEEKHIWEGKLATTFESSEYMKQIEDLTSTVLLDHKQLLMHLEMKNFPPETTHIVLDDASMLEDTATRAFGWYTSIPSLRRAAENDTTLTKLTDLLQIWIEKVRSGSDVRYLVGSDLTSRDANGLRDQITAILNGTLTTQVRSMLEHVEKILNPDNLSGRISWIEVYQNGDQVLQSVPSSIAALLRDTLFTDYSSTLLIPPKSDKILGAIIPRGLPTKTSSLPDEVLQSVPISFPEQFNLETWVQGTTGKSILLLGSRRTIEELYIKHAASLETRGVQLFCQGASGGQSRMQAEFAAASGDALLVTTPWSYEGFELPLHSADQLLIHTIPFDHPSHAIIGKRSEQFGDPFNEYSLPRAMHRLFRLLRTFSRHRTKNGSVSVLDARLRTKEYGKVIRAYLEMFKSGETQEIIVSEPEKPEKIIKKKPVRKKKEEGPSKLQQTLF